MGEGQGVVFGGDDAWGVQQAERLGLGVKSALTGTLQTGEAPWERTLFVGPGVRAPWELVPVGFRLVETWDLACPLGAQGVLAAGVGAGGGAGGQREAARGVIGDLRQPVYAHEILFVGPGARARGWLRAWRGLVDGGMEERLAFLMALHAVKPTLCALPRSWMVNPQDALTGALQAQARATGRAMARKVVTLVNVEVAPGRFVRCRPGEEARTKAAFAARGAGRAERRRASGG